jgi:uncharacterized membrane protein
MKKMFAEYRALAEADKERELNDAERQRFDYLQERAAVLQLAVMTGLVSFVASAIVSVHQSFLESLSVGGVSAVLIGMMVWP